MPAMSAAPIWGKLVIAYLAWLPTSLVGLFGGLAVVFGLVAFSFALGYAIRWRSWGQTTRGLMFLGIPASLQLLTLGMVAHAEDATCISPPPC